MPVKMAPLNPNKTYAVADIYKLNPSALLDLSKLFQVPFWQNNNLPDTLSKSILDLVHFVDLFEQLDPSSQTVLTFLAQTQGRPVKIADVFKHFFSSLGRTKLEAALQNLIDCGWVITDRQQTVLVVAEISYILPYVQPFRQFLTAPIAADATSAISRPGGQWLDDLIAVMAFIQVEQPRLTRQHLLTKQALNKLMPRLSALAGEHWEFMFAEGRYTKHFAFLLEFLDQNRLVDTITKQNNTYLVLSQEELHTFCRYSPAFRLLRAVEVFLALLMVSRPALLQRLSDIMRILADTNEKLTLPQIVLALPDKKKAPPTVTTILQESDEMYSVIFRLLHYLGLVEWTEVHITPPWPTEEPFFVPVWQLTESGRHFATWLSNIPLITWMADSPFLSLEKGKSAHARWEKQVRPLLDAWERVLPPTATQELIIQPDLTFIVPRTAPVKLLWQLCAFAETQVSDYVYQGTFTRHSLTAALKSGLSFADLLASLAEHSRIPPSDSVCKTLTTWSAGYDRVLIASTFILACDSAALADELVAQPKLAKLILGRLGDRTLIISPDAEKPLRKWLEKRNLVPRPDIVTGSELGQWLAQKTTP